MWGTVNHHQSPSLSGRCNKHAHRKKLIFVIFTFIFPSYSSFLPQLSLFFSYYTCHIHTCSLKHKHTRSLTPLNQSATLTPSGTASVIPLTLCLRSSLDTGSATPTTQAAMDALLSSRPKGVWVMAWSSCWTFSRMNIYPSGEKQVRAEPKASECDTEGQTWCAPIISLSSPSSPFRWDVVWSWGQSSDPQSRRAVLHRPARLWRLTGFSDVRLLPGTAGMSCFTDNPVELG